MIHIVGGVYHERCVHPHWDRLYGSGGRAAAALSSVTQAKLTTWIDDASRSRLQTLADGFGFEVQAEREPVTPSFDYVHPLSVPVIAPVPHLVATGTSLRAENDVVLRFGMLQGDAVVRGRRVVYDPQSAYSPEPFRENGSSADALAVVLNAHELRLITRHKDLLVAANELLAMDAAEVVVVKRGSNGALVVMKTGHADVPAYRTESVFSIGSGDMFAAAFTYFWGDQQLDPVRAADLSSRSAANYCGTKVTVLLPSSTLDDLPFRRTETTPGRVYLAGPFFTLPQRWLIEESRSHLLSMGLEVFSPFHDVGIGPAEQVAPADLNALDSCNRMLAFADGGDAGTLFEIGYARAKDVPVIVLAEAVPEEQMKMIVGSKCLVTTDFVTAIYFTAWAPT